MADEHETVRQAAGAAALRARLNEELGFYPAELDDESIAAYRRKDAEDCERYARYVRKYGGPGGSHYAQFRHLRNHEGRPQETPRSAT